MTEPVDRGLPGSSSSEPGTEAQVGGSPTILRVGAPMWSLPEWTGRYFPVETTETLAAYATWCNAVEGNTTFYAIPRPTTIESWGRQAPDYFRFCFKLPRSITHDRRLRHADDELVAFLAAVALLEDRCGPLQIQLPPSFGPDDLNVLETFIVGLPRHGWGWAVEVRHHQFFPGGTAERPLNDLLARHGVNRVLLDSRPLFAGPCQTVAEQEAFKSKPRVGVRPVATADQPLIRLIGQSNRDATEQHWQQWLPKVAEWLESGLRPFVFIHTPDNVDSPWLNRRFHAQVRERLGPGPGPPRLEPLPSPVEPDQQLDLF